ncbi:hexokinase-domain-containing protein [Mucor mucedo]|uniref:hexokinase-domain-containing protein n=1 Tax=Mucor mucedo TaxID=29922 RepID=UPI00221F3C56|nr:hexokinase-domain-containing protein [Mucor mucedo]KAI7890497.1 hexokinase-domain-containing protein [Mucor mucedo]
MANFDKPITNCYKLENCSVDQQSALEEIENLFQVSQDRLDILMRGVSQEMRDGLHFPETRDTQNDLKMIPSFVTGYPTGNEKGTYLALEISGIDIYVCQVQLKGEGGKLAINQYQYKIPDYLTVGDNMSTLVSHVADCVADFQQRVGFTTEIVYAMGISLGFAVRQTCLNKGLIVALEHGFEYTDAIGSDIVELFQKGFQKRRLSIKVVAMANDSVCTLLAHAYQHPSTRIGIVHSAGTNCAYYDKVSNMETFLSQHQDWISDHTHMIVNTEWCDISSKYMPSNKFDEMVDLGSNNKGVHAFEKMTTGMYLGELARLILVYYAGLGVLSFGMDDEECLLRFPYQFDTSYMYVCEADENSLEGTRVVLEEMCRTGETTLADREIVKNICDLVGQRAALFLGASIAGVVRYMVSDGIGLDLEGDGFAICKLSIHIFVHYKMYRLFIFESYQRRSLQRFFVLPSSCL